MLELVPLYVYLVTSKPIRCVAGSLICHRTLTLHSWNQYKAEDDFIQITLCHRTFTLNPWNQYKADDAFI